MNKKFAPTVYGSSRSGSDAERFARAAVVNRGIRELLATAAPVEQGTAKRVGVTALTFVRGLNLQGQPVGFERASNGGFRYAGSFVRIPSWLAGALLGVRDKLAADARNGRLSKMEWGGESYVQGPNGELVRVELNATAEATSARFTPADDPKANVTCITLRSAPDGHHDEFMSGGDRAGQGPRPYTRENVALMLGQLLPSTAQ